MVDRSCYWSIGPVNRCEVPFIVNRRHRKPHITQVTVNLCHKNEKKTNRARLAILLQQHMRARGVHQFYSDHLSHPTQKSLLVGNTMR